MSARSEDTADLEEKLRRKKELKRARTDEEHYARADERDPPRHHDPAIRDKNIVQAEMFDEAIEHKPNFIFF